MRRPLFRSRSPSDDRAALLRMEARDEPLQCGYFDPDFDNPRTHTRKLEVIIDGYRPGYITEHGKIALLSKTCLDEDVLEFLANMRTEGIDYVDDIGDAQPYAEVQSPT